jgi:catechol 2,3-dioxygenase-like lactoylglutathione lyase family enzyme
MPAELDHLLVPAKDRKAAAALLAGLLGVPWATHGPAGPFSPVYVNEGLTLDFDEWTTPIPQMHYCFRVTETEFDTVLERIKAQGIAFRSHPHGPANHQVNNILGGRMIYWSVPDGHVWELLTVSYERQAAPSAA